jgi:hypothetical protein
MSYDHRLDNPDTLAFAVTNAIEQSSLDSGLVNDKYSWGDQTAEKVGKGLYYFDDIKSVLYSNGEEYVAGTPIKLIDFQGQLVVPALAAANAATYSQSGNVLTVNNGVAHNIPATVFNGATVYLAIGTVSTGVAPTATVANFFANFQYVSATAFTCLATNSQDGTGAVNTNTSPTILLPLSKTYAAGLIEVGRNISVLGVVSNNNSVGVKTFNTLINGFVVHNAQASTAVNTLLGSVNAATLINNNKMVRASTIATPITFDPTQNLTVSARIDIAAANDWMCLESLRIITGK